MRTDFQKRKPESLLWQSTGDDIQLGMIVLPKTANPEHMKSNADVDFVITDEDMDALKRVETIKDYGDHSFFPVFGGKM